MDGRRSLFLAACVLTLSADPARAAGVTVQSFASMAAFEASPFYVYVTQTLTGGAPAHCATSVEAVTQGDQAVPTSSAGAASNTSVTAEILSAAGDTPTVFGGASDSMFYLKQYVSLGNETSGGPVPTLEMDMPPTSAAGAGGFQGYEIAIVDIGSNLVPGTGSRNSERTYFRVASSAGGSIVQVGQITNTGGDFINVILLDLDGLTGLGGNVDRLYVVDASGHNPPQKGAIDVDGALPLADPAVPTQVSTWGALKATYR